MIVKDMSIIIKQFTKTLEHCKKDQAGWYELSQKYVDFWIALEKIQMLVYENQSNVKTDSCNTTLTSREI